MPYSIVGTDYVYLAMKALLSEVRRFNKENTTKKIKSVACTGLGTFYGKMPYDEAARQMALAYTNFLTPVEKITWLHASIRQAAIVYGGYEGFVNWTRLEAKEKK